VPNGVRPSLATIRRPPSSALRMQLTVRVCVPPVAQPVPLVGWLPRRFVAPETAVASVLATAVICRVLAIKASASRATRRTVPVSLAVMPASVRPARVAPVLAVPPARPARMGSASPPVRPYQPATIPVPVRRAKPASTGLVVPLPPTGAPASALPPAARRNAT
jgi:hypothetical protein